MALLSKFAVGEKTVLFYLVATYGPQFLLHVFDEEALSARFRIGTGTQAFAAFVPLFFLLVLAIQKWFPKVSVAYRPLARAAARMFESRFNTLVALGLVGLAVNFLITAGITFRQSGDILSEAGLGIAAMMFSKPYIYAWLLYQYLLAMRGEIYKPARARLQALLFLVALILSVTGSLDVLPIVWSLIFCAAGPVRLRATFVAFARKRASIGRFFLRVISVPLLGSMAVLIITIGYLNKTGYDAFGDVIEQIGYEKIAEDTMVRVSASYCALISFVENNLYNFSIYEQVVAVPVENVPYRLSLILGAPLPRPEITQISRLNYLNYEEDTSLERAGASPGLVASALYAGPFPLGFLLMAGYVVLVIRIVNLPFRTLTGRPRIAVIALCTSFIYPLFETPIDYLVFIDPASLQLLLILGAFMAASVARAAHGATANEHGGVAADNNGGHSGVLPSL